VRLFQYNSHVGIKALVVINRKDGFLSILVTETDHSIENKTSLTFNLSPSTPLAASYRNMIETLGAVVTGLYVVCLAAWRGDDVLLPPLWRELTAPK
jgi:hypothetical protein